MSRSGRCKMVLLGDTSVGKSSLALRITKGYSHEHIETTIGGAFFPHSVQIDPDTALKIDLWDTAGQERFHSLAPMYYRHAAAGLVVYDITNSESFRRAKMWVKEIRAANGLNMVVAIVGNKLDLATGDKRQVNRQEVSEYAEENELLFMETSARRGDNVGEIFLTVAKQIAAKQQINSLNRTNDTISATSVTTKTTKSNICCNG
ncbi:unnamed protein product [Adineta ricciae]|uniref:Uncharacterized protein n=1 Tax=Adineta ricciae TaxID=249248 RepID=A0A815K179_ADIRI|nr:unnamed protein product [Adineta ricciae]